MMPSWLKHSLQLQQHKKDVIVSIYDHDRFFTVDMVSLMLKSNGYGSQIKSHHYGNLYGGIGGGDMLGSQHVGHHGHQGDGSSACVGVGSMCGGVGAICGGSSGCGSVGSGGGAGCGDGGDGIGCDSEGDDVGCGGGDSGGGS
jgi:hypothetical protein